MERREVDDMLDQIGRFGGPTATTDVQTGVIVSIENGDDACVLQDEITSL